ncbi:MAG: hypothetical protein KGJ62_06885 [Armatimonadetes bacterium]|nr:hypothetical protein [Armatimonadota bacterium]MDE2206260.1 hypothetical protein [Armatimonadota bacterium]
MSDGPGANAPASRRGPGARTGIAVVVALVVIMSIAVGPLYRWQQLESQRTESISNLRQLANAFLEYSQDWDDHPMEPARPLASGWQLWPDDLRGYITGHSVLSNPSNRIDPDHPLEDPSRRYAVSTSYALNRRVWGVFSPGPFPLDNLELPERTAMFVEAGPMWSAPVPSETVGASHGHIAKLTYGDTEDRYSSLFAYPSLHGNRLALVAMDGHALSVVVSHYTAASGPHDSLYGRIGGHIYNWNGGHPNGRTDQPARE